MRRKGYMCGWCESGLAHDERYPKVQCHGLIQEGRTVVLNQKNGTVVREIPETFCSCPCNKGSK